MWESQRRGCITQVDLTQLFLLNLKQTPMCYSRDALLPAGKGRHGHWYIAVINQPQHKAVAQKRNGRVRFLTQVIRRLPGHDHLGLKLDSRRMPIADMMK